MDKKKFEEKMKIGIFGSILISIGALVIIYSIFYTSGMKMFLSMDVGVLMIAFGLGMIGIHISRHPF